MKLRQAFTLIELMIVLVILGALVAVILTSFDYGESNVKRDATTVEMENIRKAFVRYYADNFPSLEAGEAFHVAAKYGISVLCVNRLPAYASGSDETIFENEAIRETDRKNKLGWQGPYIMQEGTEKVTVSDAGTDWQNPSTDNNAISVPVIYDAYEGYYRVVVPEGNLNDGSGNVAHPEKACLVCTGPNRRLETSSENIDTTTGSPTFGELQAQGDDIVLKIFPRN